MRQPPPPLTQRQGYGTLAALPDGLLHAVLCLPPLESLVMVECAYCFGHDGVTGASKPGQLGGRAGQLSWNGA